MSYPSERPPEELHHELSLIETAGLRTEEGAITPDAEAAIASLYSMHQPTAYSVIRPRVDQPATAEDLSQDVMERVLLRHLPRKAAPRIAFPNGLGSFVQVSARNRVMDHFRRAVRGDRLAFEHEAEQSERTLADPKPGVEQTVIDGHLALGELVSFLKGRGMSAERLAALTMAGLGLTYTEIAEEQGVARGTVMSRVNRARNQTRDFVTTSSLFEVSPDADFGLSGPKSRKK